MFGLDFENRSIICFLPILFSEKALDFLKTAFPLAILSVLPPGYSSGQNYAGSTADAVI
jgi:hypothetical protein